MYFLGRVVPVDHAEALKWYRLAADQGLASAQYLSGVMYQKGMGVPVDYAEALKWHRRAAERGHAKAQYGLGVMYAGGVGVTQDEVQAHQWLNLAAASGEEEARERLDNVARLMTPEQIAEALRLAREWREKRQVDE